MDCNKKKGMRAVRITEEQIKSAGMDFQLFEGLHKERLLGDVLLKAKSVLSEGGDLRRVKVRYKPKEVFALFIDNEHIVSDVDSNLKKLRKTGWLVPGPGNTVIYVPEEKFNTFLEIVNEGSEP